MSGINGLLEYMKPGNYFLCPKRAIRSEFCLRAISVSLRCAATSAMRLAMVSSVFTLMLFSLISSPAIDIE